MWISEAAGQAGVNVQTLRATPASRRCDKERAHAWEEDAENHWDSSRPSDMLSRVITKGDIALGAVRLRTKPPGGHPPASTAERMTDAAR